MSSVHDAAQYFIRRAHEEGNLITHLKLQKLCCYAQGYSLGDYIDKRASLISGGQCDAQ